MTVSLANYLRLCRFESTVTENLRVSEILVAASLIYDAIIVVARRHTHAAHWFKRAALPVNLFNIDGCHSRE